MDEMKAREKFLRNRVRILKDFGIKVTIEMEEHIKSLYPSEILAESYTRKIILQNLGE